MTDWPNPALLDRLGVHLPIIQAPMAGCNDEKLALAVSRAGGLGSLPCAMMTAEGVRAAVSDFADLPYCLNFFCHEPVAANADELANWASLVAAEAGVDADELLQPQAGGRRPFDEAMCELVVALRPRAVSFHFGLPEPVLLEPVKRCGTFIMSSATTLEEGRWLASRGCDAIIAQGSEAGGHRGCFLPNSLGSQMGTAPLVAALVGCVEIPVIAAGGIANGADVARFTKLGAAMAQIGTAYLLSDEALTPPHHRAALRSDRGTVLTNVLTGKPARGIRNRFIDALGPMHDEVPAFPHAAAISAPLRQAAERNDSDAYSPLWAGEAYRSAVTGSATTLTHQWSEDAAQVLKAQSR